MTQFISHFGSDNDINVSDEIFMMRLRYWRDIQLKESDWTQIADAPVDKTAWSTYRQALRDLPASNTDPRKIELPSVPN